MIVKSFRLCLLFSFGFFFAACGGQQKQPQTLADLDTQDSRGRDKRSEKSEKTVSDVRGAYYDYIQGAAKDDRFRLQAATRIAELELSIEHQKRDERQFEAAIRETIVLLEAALQDFPDADGNDHSLYQLAKAYDQIGETEKAAELLERLAFRYPDSPYFVEARFRVAENAFIHGEYFRAEDAYTDVVKHAGNHKFLEKALFKRGWSRFKQELYNESLADFYSAVDEHGFADLGQLNEVEKPLFDEYFRGIGLAFSYSGGVDAIADFFKSNQRSVYIYQTYLTVAELLEKQERYNDSVSVYHRFGELYPFHSSVIEAQIEGLKTWKEAGFFNRYVEDFNSFYARYSPKSDFWNNPKLALATQQKKLAETWIKEQVTLLAAYYHSRYKKNRRPADFDLAQTWYERYLRDYQSFARQDRIYQLYGDLLDRAGRKEDALFHYEIAAFDGDIVLDKESAYNVIAITKRLYGNSKERAPELLEKYLKYSFLFVELHPDDPKSPEVALSATQLAFNTGDMGRCIELANALPAKSSAEFQKQVSLIKAQAYFNLDEFSEAELVYRDLLAKHSQGQVEQRELQNKVALSLFRQGEVLRRKGQVELASHSFIRIYQEFPSSDFTASALYDAASILFESSQWKDAIFYFETFRDTYPSHEFSSDISKKLSLAYLNSNRNLEAAREFEKISDLVANEEEKMVALWQAAKLYYEKEELTSALRAYKEYAHTYKRPFAENMEAMLSITDIYQRIGERSKKAFWLRKILQEDNKVGGALKTDRTEYIAATSAYELAFLRRDDFSRIKLNLPLAKNLKAKKQAMQDAVKLYGRAASYGLEDYVTQATLAIGEIYEEFAIALMQSERPRNLNADELEQYNILIEDQVFPFEDKAIEFHEANVQRIAGGVFDKNIKDSLKRLQKLYPVRYKRDFKIEKAYPIGNGSIAGEQQHVN